ncbi:hypothetical protein B4135_1727 [Caldibacillus debilis]|uniref:Uncharacterized protein n=1 Tax=Caldibacillus debilis TaxID=301148 RepID=A0A150M8V8_9BACI|nr:hypothetical protein B4135_1727 [Caldibacillus debilis]
MCKKKQARNGPYCRDLNPANGTRKFYNDLDFTRRWVFFL